MFAVFWHGALILAAIAWIGIAFLLLIPGDKNTGPVGLTIYEQQKFLKRGRSIVDYVYEGDPDLIEVRAELAAEDRARGFKPDKPAQDNSMNAVCFWLVVVSCFMPWLFLISVPLTIFVLVRGSFRILTGLVRSAC